MDFDAAFHTSSCSMPIVLISSSDQPLNQLTLFAEQRLMPVMHLAIGRGQGATADKIIRSSVCECMDACMGGALTCLGLHALLCVWGGGTMAAAAHSIAPTCQGQLGLVCCMQCVTIAL